MDYGPPVMSKYEKTQVLGTRVRELSMGAQTTIDCEGITDLLTIAKMELTERRMPIKIVRKIQGKLHTINVNQLELVDN